MKCLIAIQSLGLTFTNSSKAFIPKHIRKTLGPCLREWNLKRV